MANYPRASPARWWKTKSIGKPHRSPHAMFVGRTRWWASMLLLVILVMMVGGGWYLANPRRISQMAGILLSHVLGGHVTVATGRVSLAGTIELSGVRLRTRNSHGPAATIFSADRVQVRFNWLSLLNGHLRATQLTAVHPVLNLVDNRDTGRWNYQSFLHFHGGAASGPAVVPSPVIGQRVAGPTIHLPAIQLHSAVIRWGRVEHGRYAVTGQSVIDAQLGPVPRRRSVYQMEIQQRSVDGRAGINISGRWNVSTHRLDAHIPRLVLSRAFRRTLPAQLQDWWRRFHFQGELRNISMAVGPYRGIRIAATLKNVSMHLIVPSRRVGAQVVPIEHLSGLVRAGSTATHISNLTGSILGFAFKVPEASFDGYADNSPFDVRLDLPGFDLPRKYPAILSTRPLALARAIIYRLRPSGKMDITIHVHKSISDAVPRIRGAIVCHGVSARYVHFPYPFYDVRGLIRFSRHAIRFVDLRGKAEQYPMTLTGLVSINEDNGPIDLHIASPQILFDQRLGACLPHDLAPIWARFNPVGTGHFYCHVVRAAGSTADPDIRIHIFPTDTSGRYSDFPYPLSHVHGEMLFANHTMRIIRLAAPVAIRHPVPGGPTMGKIVFTGSVAYNSGSLRDLRPHVRVVATNVPVNKLLWQSMPRSYGKWLRTFHVRGLAGMDALITRGPNGDPSVRGTLTLRHGRIRYSMLPWPVTHLAIQGDLGPSHLTLSRIDGLTGQGATGGIEAAAGVRESPDGRVAVTVRGRWNGVNVSGTPATKLPAAWQKAWKSAKPTGRINGLFSAAIDVSPGSSGKSHITIPHYRVTVTPVNMSLNYKPLGAPIRNIQGSVAIHPGRIVLNSIEARLDNVQLYAHGDYLFKTRDAALSLYASAPDLDPKLVQVLPAPARRFIKPLDPHGAWYLTLSSLSRTVVDKKSQWSFAGNLIVAQASTGGWFKTSASNAAVSLAGRWLQGQSVPDVVGQFSLTKLTVGGKLLNPLSGRIVTDATARTISIGRVKGRVAGGTLQGAVRLNVGKNARYKADFSLANVRLGRLLAENYPGPLQPTHNSGRVDATLHLTGELANAATRSGRGRLTISKASLFNVPLAMGLMQIATLRLPISRAFTHAGLTYTLRHNTVHFSNISLHSSGINVVGNGKLNMRTRKLNIHMQTESPSGTRLPVIGFFFGLARAQLLQIWINGTVAHPKVHAVPLRLLSWPFE